MVARGMYDAVGDITLAEIIADKMKAKDDSAGLHDKIKEWRRWYAFDHYHGRGVAKPEEERYQDPTPTNIVDMAVGIITSEKSTTSHMSRYSVLLVMERL